MIARIWSMKPRCVHVVAKKRFRHKFFLVIMLLLCAAAGLQEYTNALRQHVYNPVIRVYDIEKQQLLEMNLETYLVGVVAAEMPASFAMDALKAQAVAARTFAINRMRHPNPNVTAIHSDAQITSSSATCQAWIDEKTQKERWGNAYDVWHNKIEQAIAETAGEILYYDGEPIEPVYHASCGGGFTEDAEQVWGSAKPYLVSVPCNHPTDKHSNETQVFTLQELAEKLQLPDTIAVRAMYDTAYIKLAEKTVSNRVKKVQIGETTVSGGVLRSALGLKSTMMTWALSQDCIIFTTNGYGHGVGMCQQGAGYYAEQGYSYRQILQLYYPGTSLGSCK